MRLRQAVTDEIADYGEQFTLYKPVAAVKADLNVVADRYALTGTAMGHIQFADTIEDKATALGVFGTLAGDVVFAAMGLNTVPAEVLTETLVFDRSVIVDSEGTPWLIHGPPVRPRGPETLAVTAVVTQLKFKPNGVS